MTRFSRAGVLALGAAAFAALTFPALAQKPKPIVNLTAIFGKKASLLNAALGKPKVAKTGAEYDTPEASFIVTTKDGKPDGVITEVDVTLKKPRKTPEEALAAVGIRVKPPKQPATDGFEQYTKAIGCPAIKFMSVQGTVNGKATDWNQITVTNQTPSKDVG